MREEVVKAVESFDGYMDAVLGEYPSGEDAWQTIRQALRDQEAEIAQWSDRALHQQRMRQELQERVEQAETLLRELRLCINETRGKHAFDVVAKVDAHLTKDTP